MKATLTTTDQSSHRIYLWDNVKFLLIFLVVFGHFITCFTKNSAIARNLYLYIWSYHMPAFIFISGLFSKKNIQEKRYRKIFEYFILYLFIKFYLFFICAILHLDNDYSFLSEEGVPWYAFALFAFSLLTICLRNLDRKYLFIFALVLGCFAGYSTDLNDTLVSSRIIVFYPFFLAGYFLDGKKIMEFAAKKWMKPCALGIHLFLILLICLQPKSMYRLRPLLSGRANFKDIGMFYCMERAVYYVVVFILIFSVVALVPNIKNICSTWGSRSVQVYALHRGFIYLFFVCFPENKLLRILGEGPLILLLFVLSALLTAVLSLKFWQKPLNIFLKPKWNANP